MNASANAQNAAIQLAIAESAPPSIAAPAQRRAKPLPSPALLRQRLPLSTALAIRVQNDRSAIRAVLDGRDSRLLVVVGPCSLHDPVAAQEYAERLAAAGVDRDAPMAAKDVAGGHGHGCGGH